MAVSRRDTCSCRVARRAQSVERDDGGGRLRRLRHEPTAGDRGAGRFHRRRSADDRVGQLSTARSSSTITGIIPRKFARRSQALRGRYQPAAAALRVSAASAQPDAISAGGFRRQLRAGGRNDRAGHLFCPRQRSRTAARQRRDLVERIEANGQQAVHLPQSSQIVEYLQQNGREPAI